MPFFDDDPSIDAGRNPFSGAPWNPITTPSISVPQAGKALNLGRCAAYRAVREGRIPVVKTGERTMRVPTVAMLRLLGYTPSGIPEGGDFRGE